MSNTLYADAAKSTIGPLEELHLISYIAEGDGAQEKIEKALKRWSDKWLVEYGYKEVIEKKGLESLSKAEVDKIRSDLIQKAKQAIGEAVAVASATLEEGPLHKADALVKGDQSVDANYRTYRVLALRRWEK